MPAPVSVVIPTLDAARTIAPCLTALVEGLQDGLLRDLVIADGGSADGIAAIAEALGATLVQAPRGRGGQIAAGIAAARGDWLLVLHADTVPEPGWTAAVRRHIAAGPGRAGHFALRFDAPGLLPALVAGWANLRARAFGLPWGDQGLLVHRSLLAKAGGYPDLPLMEDVEMARRLAGRLVPLPATLRTSAERYRREGWLRRGMRNHLTFLRYRLGVPPDRLLRFYEGGGRG